tara:strand:- start:246 stop:524 length:279 start_codon:yes stop_codon:yes gene_type:complete
MYFVYLLISKNKKRTISYVGYTNNLKKRLNLHNISKGAKFTRGRFWKLAFYKIYKTKSLALKEEYKLKKDYNLRTKIKKNFIKNENICTSSL